MRKLFLALLGLIVAVTATGCFNKSEGNNNIPVQQGNKPNDSGAGGTSEPKASKIIDLQIDLAWSSQRSPGESPPSFTPRTFEANVSPYRIASDMANVSNWNQFRGFTKEQQSMLAGNGFVVLPSRDTKMFYVYDQNEYSGVPHFITADSVLHTYHSFYDKSLAFVEASYLSEDLKLLSNQMLEQSVLLNDELDDDLKGLQLKNIAFFQVAKQLIDPNAKVTAAVPEEAMAFARQELQRIEQAQGFAASPLFGFDLDYSQFKVRGHYTRSEKLGDYFRTMMWLGTAPLPLIDKDGKFQYDNTLQALLMSLTTFLKTKGKSNVQLWNDIYDPTEQYVGASDDIQLLQMNDVRVSVFGEGNDPNLFNDNAYYDKLLEAVEALPEPRIQGKLTSATTPTGKQFRYMGQRYIMDGFIMQNLMEPLVRPVPTALDVMGVLGSSTAEKQLFEVRKPQLEWPDYETNYRRLKSEVGGYSNETWSSNLYNGWLWSIQAALTEFAPDSGMPWFMTNDSWKHKSLNTAFGSYTELKHDSVLYGKQPMAEMGGPEAFAKSHYVEPNVALYSKLLYLTDDTIELLERRGMLNETMRMGAEDYKKLLELLIDCSLKELRNEPLTDEENDRLLWYGGTLENIGNTLLSGMADGISEGESALELSDMLVSDIATVAPTPNNDEGILSLGTGYFDHIYVVVPLNGELALARGSVYSSYEFLGDTRLTDEEWWELHGLRKTTADFGEYLEITNPSPKLPKQPAWTKTFKTDSNKVEIDMPNVDWDELSE